MEDSCRMVATRGLPIYFSWDGPDVLLAMIEGALCARVAGLSTLD